MMIFPSAPPPSRAASVARKFVWPLRALKVDRSRSVSSSQLNWLFSNPPKSSAHASGAWRHSHPLVLGVLFWHLWTTHPPRARVNRKFLSLTKPKGKIYKTKSLGHYITYWRNKNTAIERLQRLLSTILRTIQLFANCLTNIKLNY